MPVATSGNFISYKNSRLYYSKSGRGSVSLLLFHGFGQTNLAFQEWISELNNDFTIYSFDLYFHGQSTWPDRQALEKKDWTKIIDAFLLQENISGFEVAGFSLGGKFAIATLESFPEKVRRLILLAPDGIKTSFWYSLATYPIAIRALFKSMVLHPDRFYKLAGILRRAGLVNKGILLFAESQMDTEEKRKRVYFSWVYFRHLKFDLRSLTTLINQFEIPLLVITGKFDRVIPSENLSSFLRRINKKQVEELESGHNELIRHAKTLIHHKMDFPPTTKSGKLRA